MKNDRAGSWKIFAGNIFPHSAIYKCQFVET